MTKEFQSVIVQKGRLLPGIHGLRGLAALAVVLYHLNHLSGISPPLIFGFIGRDFGYSVHLFFILSAFSLCYSTAPHTNQTNWVYEYFLKRFFRIAPLFYFIILFEIFRQFTYGGIVTDLNSFLLNITFTFGFVPFSGFVWGGWSVGVEMIFYVIFPVLLLTIRTIRAAFIILAFSVLISGAIRSGLHLQHLASVSQSKWDWSYFSFASNICFFAMGIFAYYLSILYKNSIITVRIFQYIAISIIFLLLFFDVGRLLHGGWRLDIIFWGFGLMSLCIWQSVSPSVIFANRIFEYLGERSFSIYLLHPIIISFSKKNIINIYDALDSSLGAGAFFICASLVMLLIIIVAEMTYRFIEVPGIKLGRKLILQRRLL